MENAPNFGEMFETVAAAKAQPVSSDEELRGARRKIVEDIRQSMVSGDIVSLHRLQSQFEKITSELRSRYAKARMAAAGPLLSVKDVMAGQPKAEPKKTIVAEASIPQNPFGVSASLWEAVNKDNQWRPTLASLPQAAVDVYRQLSLADKKEMAKHLNEKTRVLFFTVDNRQAFITGQVMGRDTFQYLGSAVDKQVNEGKMTAQAGALRKSELSILKELTPAQREAFIRLMEEEVKGQSAG